MLLRLFGGLLCFISILSIPLYAETVTGSSFAQGILSQLNSIDTIFYELKVTSNVTDLNSGKDLIVQKYKFYSKKGNCLIVSDFRNTKNIYLFIKDNSVSGNAGAFYQVFETYVKESRVDDNRFLLPISEQIINFLCSICLNLNTSSSTVDVTPTSNRVSTSFVDPVFENISLTSNQIIFEVPLQKKLPTILYANKFDSSSNLKEKDITSFSIQTFNALEFPTQISRQLFHIVDGIQTQKAFYQLSFLKTKINQGLDDAIFTTQYIQLHFNELLNFEGNNE